jgi:carboxybiotin decarboxylase
MNAKRKFLTIIGIISLLSAVWFLFIRANDSENDSLPKTTEEIVIDKSLSDSEIRDLIIGGKWMFQDNYKIRTNSEITKKKYQSFTFFEDGKLRMDSVKQQFLGSWAIEEGNVILTFQQAGLEVKLAERIVSVDKEGHLIINGNKYKNYNSAVAGLLNFYEFTGFASVGLGHLIMMIIGCVFIFLAIRYNYEPLLLIPIGVGILIGNIPFYQVADFNLKLGIYESQSVMNYLYFGVTAGIYPPLIFLGIGAMTDFSSLISNPRLMLLGAAAQIGIFLTFLGAIILGFAPAEAGAIGIIGGADGPTAIFLSSKLANGINILGYTASGAPIVVKNLIGPIAIAAYSYMALVPVIQPPIMKLLTSKKERLMRMKAPRSVSRTEKILFPILGLILTCFIAPSAIPLLGMLFFGNLLKESGVTKRLATTSSNALVDIVNILLGLTVGASTQADIFLTKESILIFGLGALSFMVATAGGLMFAKFMNLFLRGDNKINPLVGAAGVSAVPDSARVVQHEALKEDPNNHLLMHAMAPNVSGVIGSAVAAGVLLSFLL